MLMEIFNRYRRWIILAAVAFPLALIIIAVYINTRNPNGNYLTVSNLSDYTSGKATDDQTLDRIEHFLYKTVSLNISRKLDNDSIKDIVVRKDSFSQKLNKTTGVYTVKFIADIKSLSQSYAVSYQWSEEEEFSEHIDEYGTQVTCPPIDKLVYGDFSCVDENILLIGKENYDPVQLILPYHVPSKFKIVDYSKFQATVLLNVEAYAPRWAASVDKTLLKEYEEEITAWLESRKLDPKKYSFNFIY